MESSTISGSKCESCIPYQQIQYDNPQDYLGNLEKAIHDQNETIFIQTAIEAAKSNYMFSFCPNNSQTSLCKGHDYFIGDDIKRSVETHGAFVAKAMKSLKEKDQTAYDKLADIFLNAMGAKFCIVDPEEFCILFRNSIYLESTDSIKKLLTAAKEEGFSIHIHPEVKEKSKVITIDEDLKVISFHDDTTKTLSHKNRKEWLKSNLIPSIKKGDYNQPYLLEYLEQIVA